MPLSVIVIDIELFSPFITEKKKTKMDKLNVVFLLGLRPHRTRVLEPEYHTFLKQGSRVNKSEGAILALACVQPGSRFPEPKSAQPELQHM